MLIRLLSIIILSVIATTQQASAVSTLTFPLERPTSRTIERTSTYLRIIDYLQRKNGVVRQRSAVGRLQEQDRGSLRRWDLRNTRTQRRTSALVNRQRTYQTPTLQRSRFSLYSKLPIEQDTQIAYRNGIKYYRGDGVPKSNIYAYMWLSYALADGHPLARSSLLTVQRRMSQNQLRIAEDFRDRLSYNFLQVSDVKKSSIRDATRQNHVDQLLNAMVRYSRDHKGQYPDIIPRIEPKELCHSQSTRCSGYLDFAALKPTYVISIPDDPLVPSDLRGSGYAVFINKTGHLVVEALYAEQKKVSAQYRSY